MVKKIQIRKAKKEDLKEIIKVMLAEFSKPPFNEKVSFSSAIKSLKFYFKLGQIYVALINREIIGAIVFKTEQYWEGKVLIIEDLVVKEQFRKQKVGKNMIDFVEDYSKKKNIKRILFTTNRKSKEIDFYKKRGYKEEKNVINMMRKIR